MHHNIRYEQTIADFTLEERLRGDAGMVGGNGPHAIVWWGRLVASTS
jgi:hypothetical protein